MSLSVDSIKLEMKALELAVMVTGDPDLKARMAARVNLLAQQIQNSNREPESKSATQVVKKYGEITSDEWRKRFSNLTWFTGIVQSRFVKLNEEICQKLFLEFVEMSRAMASVADKHTKVTFNAPKQSNCGANLFELWEQIFNKEFNIILTFGGYANDGLKIAAVWNKETPPFLNWLKDEGLTLIKDSLANFGSHFAAHYDSDKNKIISFVGTEF